MPWNRFIVLIGDQFKLHKRITCVEVDFSHGCKAEISLKFDR